MDKIIPKAGQPEFKFYLFTHIDFDIKYNGDRVIEINVLADPQQAVDISEDTRNVKVGGVWVWVLCVWGGWLTFGGALGRRGGRGGTHATSR